MLLFGLYIIDNQFSEFLFLIAYIDFLDIP